MRLFTFGCAGSLLPRGRSLVVASGGCPSPWGAVSALEHRLLGTRGFRRWDPRARFAWRPGSQAQAHWLCGAVCVAQWHVGSSRTRDQTHGPGCGRRVLNHWTTGEVPGCFLMSTDLFLSPIWWDVQYFYPFRYSERLSGLPQITEKRVESVSEPRFFFHKVNPDSLPSRGSSWWCGLAHEVWGRWA